MAYTQLWTPKRAEDIYQYADQLHKPEANLRLFYNYTDRNHSERYTDHYTGDEVNFGSQVVESDNKIRNLNDVWLHVDGYAHTTVDKANQYYHSWHIGVIPGIHTPDQVKTFTQHMLPGYIGLRFQYRWPANNDRNYWGESPAHINDFMIHYYNPKVNEIWSYEVDLWWASPSNANHHPDRFVSDSSRRSNTWKGCYYRPKENGARSEIRNNQLFMVGASVEMKYSGFKTMSKPRGMDIKNMTPMWSRPGGHEYAPVLGRERANTWTTGNNGKMRLYKT